MAFLMKRNYTGNEFWKDKKQITYHFWLCRIYCLAALCSLPHNCKHRIHTYLCRIGCMYHKQHIHLDLKGKLASFLRRFIVGYFFPPEEYIFSPNFGNRLFFFFLKKEPTPTYLFKPQNLNVKFIIILRVTDKIKLKIKSFILKENLFAFLMARLKVLGYLCKGITCTLMNICSIVLVFINLAFSVF